MNIGLLDPVQAQHEMHKLALSKEYWVIPLFSHHMMEFGAEIEETYFRGGNEDGYLLFIAPDMKGVAFAKKDLLSIEELTTYLSTLTGQPEVDIETALEGGRDFLLPLAPEETWTAEEVVTTLATLLGIPEGRPH